MTKKDRPPVAPFTIQEAESLISRLRADWGDAIGNYDEFRFFSGLRPSEQIALLVTDYNAHRGVLSVTKARVLQRDKDRTKTQEDRDVELYPRALEVLKRHLALRDKYVAAGKIHHEHLFNSRFSCCNFSCKFCKHSRAADRDSSPPIPGIWQ
jgi:integrase